MNNYNYNQCLNYYNNDKVILPLMYMKIIFI